ncbi:MAG: hypothetical protein V3U75_06095 [Methylococcaceae bacterium]
MKAFLLSVLLLISTSSFAANSTRTTPANFFDCHGDNGLTVNYTTSSLIAQPTLSISVGGNTYFATGDEISDQKTVLGSLLTLTKESLPDLYTDTLTFVKPDVNVNEFGESVDFIATVFSTRSHTSFGGPRLVEGVIQRSRLKLVHCTATAVVF